MFYGPFLPPTSSFYPAHPSFLYLPPARVRIVRQAQDLLPDYFDRGELKADVDEQEVPADDGGLA